MPNRLRQIGHFNFGFRVKEIFWPLAAWLYRANQGCAERRGAVGAALLSGSLTGGFNRARGQHGGLGGAAGLITRPAARRLGLRFPIAKPFAEIPRFDRSTSRIARSSVALQPTVSRIRATR